MLPETGQTMTALYPAQEKSLLMVIHLLSLVERQTLMTFIMSPWQGLEAHNLTMILILTIILKSPLQVRGIPAV